MHRRHFLAAASGVGLTALAGCTGDDATVGGGGGAGDGDDSAGANDAPTDADDLEAVWADLEEVPAFEDLLDRHFETLEQVGYASEEYERNPYRVNDPEVIETTVRSDGTRTLVEGTDAADDLDGGEERAWITERARIESAEEYPGPFHVHRPDGTRARPVQRQTLQELVEFLVYERVDASDTDASVHAFEATGLTEEATETGDDYVLTLDVRLELHEAGYLASMAAEVATADSPDVENPEPVVYEYDVTEVGGVDVSEPAFVDDAIRIHGELADDLSHLALEHAGGPRVGGGTALQVRDAQGTGYRDGSQGDYPTMPDGLEPGEVAYVYWDGPSSVSIDVGEPPSDVYRAFERDDVDVRVEPRFLGRFAVRFG